MKIGYQGSIGSYSYEATSLIFINQKDYVGHTLSEDVFDSLKEKRIHKAVLPIENSIIGNIDINTELIHQNDISIVGEYYLPIKHFLYSLDSENIKTIDKVYSHPAALAQCQKFLKKHSITPMIDFDTGGACQKLCKGKYSAGSAVIAGPSCQKTYKSLRVLSKDIQNNQTNYTRFVTIENSNNTIEPNGNKFSLSLITGHNPGALLEVLSVFRNLKINLTKLESMPIPTSPFEYTFFIDGEVTKNEGNIWDMLKNGLHNQKVNFKFLGIYNTHQRHLWNK